MAEYYTGSRVASELYRAKKSPGHESIRDRRGFGPRASRPKCRELGRQRTNSVAEDRPTGRTPMGRGRANFPFSIFHLLFSMSASRRVSSPRVNKGQTATAQVAIDNGRQPTKQRLSSLRRRSTALAGRWFSVCHATRGQPRPKRPPPSQGGVF